MLDDWLNIPESSIIMNIDSMLIVDTNRGVKKMSVPVNYWAVLTAAVACYAIGAIWYGVLFSSAWKSLSGIKEMNNTPKTIVVGLVGSLLMAWILSHNIVFASAFLNTSGLHSGLMSGLFNWLGFIAPVTVGMVIYENKPWSLWVLHNGYWLLSMLAMGTILGLWR